MVVLIRPDGNASDALEGEFSLMDVQVTEIGQQAGVEKFVALGTVCACPKFTPAPFEEENLLPTIVSIRWAL